MFLSVYLVGNEVIVPSLAITDTSLYMEVEPVRSVASTSTYELRSMLREMAAGELRQIPHPARNAFPKSVVVVRAKLKNWTEFEKKVVAWSLGVRPEAKITPLRRGEPRGLMEVSDAVEKFPDLESAIDRMVQLIQVKSIK